MGSWSPKRPPRPRYCPQSKICQGACKPGSVPRAVSRGTGRAAAAIRLGFGLLRSSSSQPGRSMRNAPARLRGRAAPIRPCSGWGLPCGPRCRSPGALLPHPFTLAWTCKQAIGGLLSVALSLSRYPRTATGRALPATLVSWSPDFPRTLRHAAARPPGGTRDRANRVWRQARHWPGARSHWSGTSDARASLLPHPLQIIRFP